MSAKASVKTLVSGEQASRLFKWVALLTGSKNALKGAGFFVGAALLQWLGFRAALAVLAGSLLLVLLITLITLPSGMGRMPVKPHFRHIFSTRPAINWLSAARFFLFGSRDVWFVVGLPVFLYDVLGWSFTGVGSFLALWVIGYGVVQALAPNLLRWGLQTAPNGNTTLAGVLILALIPAGIAIGLHYGFDAQSVLLIGLTLFGIIFALNSAIHSYLVLAYAGHDRVALDVGFYYMANAAGRLTGTLLSGWAYQTSGLQACLWYSSLFVLIAAMFSSRLPAIDRMNKAGSTP